MRSGVLLFVLFSVANLLLIPVGMLSAQKPSKVEPKSIQSPSMTNDSLLIKNIYLIGREDSLGDVRVNILVIDGILQLVTRDDILLGQGVTTLDAGNGFLMGNMVIGASPSFVILDQNPREDFDIFLNTGAHVRFAMNKGKVVTNKLAKVQVTMGKPKPKRGSWSAYTPPPMAVPINYYNSRKWNKFENKFFSGLFNGALALDRLRWLSQDDNSKGQVGDLSESSIGEVRALRFGLIGTINFKTPWVYTFFLANNAFEKGYNSKTDNGLIVYDLRLDIPLPHKMNLSIGKQKEPISMERLTTLMFLPWQERYAAADAFLPARNYGVLVNGTALEDRSTWAVGVFKNWIDSDTSFAHTPNQLVGRITVLPFVSSDESNLLHLGVALRYSDASLELSGQTEAEFFQAPVFVQTEKIQADYLFTYNLEAYWRKGPYLVGLELIKNNVHAPHINNPRPWGFNISGSWIVSGEMRPYRKRSGLFDPVPVSKPVTQGGWGALEVGFSYSTIDLNEGELSGGKMDTYSFGANWWLSQKVQFGANYRYITLDRLEINGRSSGFNLRLMMILD